MSREIYRLATLYNGSSWHVCNLHVVLSDIYSTYESPIITHLISFGIEDSVCVDALVGIKL